MKFLENSFFVFNKSVTTAYLSIEFASATKDGTLITLKERMNAERIGS